jgi:hypothetical protein
MNIQALITPAIELLDFTHSFVISRDIFSLPNGRREFNQKIRENVEKAYGVYLIGNEDNSIVYYIGMAGRLRNDGIQKSHTLQNRLTASRYKDATGKDIQTNDWIRHFMDANEIQDLNFHILYTKTEEPAAYVEALLMYRYYKHFKQIPMLNSEF